ncbi:MAG: ABC transporter ATP-binding protein, partial [Myxococcales bacterium]|nr:ABC transporter ATP-binding protein [Myxococcales bacterium]
RVAIARAISKRPAILMCDEPTGALDINTGKLVLEVLDRINREFGTTTAIITHNAGISRMAERTISLADGQIAEITTRAERVPASELDW